MPPNVGNRTHASKSNCHLAMGENHCFPINCQLLQESKVPLLYGDQGKVRTLGNLHSMESNSRVGNCCLNDGHNLIQEEQFSHVNHVGAHDWEARVLTFKPISRLQVIKCTSKQVAKAEKAWQS